MVRIASVLLISLLSLHFVFVLTLVPQVSWLAVLLFILAMAIVALQQFGFLSNVFLLKNPLLRTIGLILLVSFATVVLETANPAIPSRNNVAIVGANIITGQADTEVIADATVLIASSGSIVNVGKAQDIAIPEGYRVIDASGRFLMPGLINAHSHLWRDAGDPDLPFDPASFAPPGIAHDISVYMAGIYIGQRVIASRIEQNAQKALYTGVTTAREIGNIAFLDVAFRDRVTRNERIGPNMLVAGKILATTGGHSAEVGLVFDGPVEARRAVRKALRNRVDLIKITGTGGISDSRRLGEAGELQMTPDELQAIVDEAHRRNFLVAVHAESTQGVREALQAGADNIEHGAALDEDMIALFKDNPRALRGFTSLHPTLSIFGGSVEWTDEARTNPALTVIGRNFEMVAQSLITGFKQAVDNDILVGLGTDAGFASHEMVWKELKYFVKYAGVTTSQAIHMGTLATAKSIGIDEVTGSIEPGKRADLLVLEGDPRQDLSVIGKPLIVSVNGIIHNLRQ
ncbi:MAG: amidohydrolase family protein [Halioglobus sp.]